MTNADNPVQDLIAEGQGLVRSLASQVYRKIPMRVDMDDLIAYGQIGLAEAARDFNSDRGVLFTTFAYYRIRGAIYDGVSKMSWTSRARYNRLRYEQMAAETLRYENETVPPTDISTIEQEALWLQNVTEKLAIVYFQTGGDGGPSERESTLVSSAETPFAQAISREIANKLHELVDVLPAIERRLINTIYFDGANLQEAANRLGISKSWASRLHAKTLEQLARALRTMDVADCD